MLFHVRLTHDGAHCPGYHAELLPIWVDSITRRHEIASQVGVTLHALYSALPEHHEFIIVEADSPAQVGAFVAQLYPTEQAAIEMTALTTAEDLLAMAARMSGRFSHHSLDITCQSPESNRGVATIPHFLKLL